MLAYTQLNRYTGSDTEQTTAAARDFQLSEGLSPDGQIGAALLSRLNQLAGFTGPGRVGNTPTPTGGLTGTWYDNYLNRHEIVQSGNEFQAVVFTPTNAYFDEVEGVVSGDRLIYRYQTIGNVSGSGVGTLQPDGVHINTVSSDHGSGESETDPLRRGQRPSAGY